MVDIIIPIYNAYDVLRDCLNSVLKNTDLKINRLILVNDKSTDSRIYPMLDNYCKTYSEFNIVLLDNKHNLGFVGSVNRAMKYSEKNDVLLLNSDTEVPPNWIENIKKCAYSQPDVATVTALSNNATLASVPIGLTKNALPENMTFEDYALLVKRTSFRKYPQIPTAHGFCMYIKRNVLDIVGYFDEDSFEKGYGEENDFSYRCMDYGFKHLLCDDVIVWHKESQSFSDEKVQLIKNHMEILKTRYPAYTSNTEQWCTNFPISDICDNVLYQIESYTRKNILILIHDWSNLEENVGGTTLHCRDLITNLRGKFNFHVLAPEKNSYRLHSYFKSIEKHYDLKCVPDHGMRSFYDSDYRNLIKALVQGLGISFVHIHHMLGHYFDVLPVCKEKAIPIAMTIHDFYCLCPTINLLYMSNEYCMDLKEKNCAACLKQKIGVLNDIIPNWQRQWNCFLSRLDLVIFPSISTKSIVESKLEHLNSKVIEHGIDLQRVKGKNREEDAFFNVAFVGVMTKHKGSDVLEYLINNCEDKRIKFHLFGDSQVDILKKNKPNYIYHGKYKREQLPALLNEQNINIVCNLSIWPETYSYTLTETIASGKPVLCYNLGAVAERVKRYNLGWVVKDKSEESVMKAIEDIANDTNEYNQRIKSINSYIIKSVEEMITSYSDIYETSKYQEIDVYNIAKLFEWIEQRKKENEIPPEVSLYLNSRRWKIMKKIKVPKLFRK